HGSLAAVQGLAEISYRQGDFDQAREYYQQILAEAAGHEDMLDDVANACAWLGIIALARNELDTAEAYAARAIEPAQRRGEELDLAMANITLARIQQARGQPEQATERLQTLTAQIRIALPRQQVQVWQARLALTRGDVASVEQWYAALAP